MWLWSLALAGTVAGFAAALRALLRADAAVASLRLSVEALDGIHDAAAALDRRTAATTARRTALGHRSQPAP